MSVTITIKGTPIEFPSSGESPNWAPALIDFAKTTQDALNSAVGPYDISPQVFSLASNVNTPAIEVQNLSFPSSAVRAGFIKYAVIRKTDSNVKSESGNIVVVFDGNTWKLTRDFVGDADCEFTIESSGQIKIKTPNQVIGDNYTGSISFSAQALSQVN